MFTRSSGYIGSGTAGATLLAATLLSLPTGLLAAPRVFEETAKIDSPDPTYTWPLAIAVDGDFLIATGFKDLDGTHPGMGDDSAWLYQRQSNGKWTLLRRLVRHIVPYNLSEPTMKVDMQGGVAAILKEGASWIFERSGSSWNSVASPLSTDGMDVEVSGGTIAVSAGRCSWEANAYRKGTNGAWALVRSTPPQPDEFCENEDERGDVDVSGNAIIVATWGNEVGPYSARIFEGPFGTPAITTTLTAPPGDPYVYTDPVAIDLPSALVRAGAAGVAAYTRASSGTWNASGSLLRPDNLAVGSPYNAKVRGGLAVLGYPVDLAHGPRSGSVSVFQRNSNGTYRYVAKLVASDRDPEHYFGFKAKINGRRAVVSAHGAGSAYVFDLPTDLNQPATVQDTFQDGNASDWTPLAGSSFTVATTSTSRVYRQSSSVGNAASIWNNTDRTNQAVAADIKPTAYATTTGDKWFGLVARYTDASNYYYVTMRNNNTVLLRRMVNGVFTTLDTAPLPIALNRNYHVRLEAIGTRLRLFVDSQLLAEASDSTHSHGQAGVMMYKTRADYDNVIVSSNPHTTLVTYEFRGENESLSNWQTLGTWTEANGVYAQSDLASGARSIGGIATDDQVVQARIRRTGAAGTNNWFGLATRYRDAGNYYYLTVRNDNTIALRKLLNNAIVELDSAPFTVTTNTWYRVRFAAIGTQLRVYINDQLQLEAADSSHASGKYGPVMYRTAAEYDDILAVQP
jgi:hypothetical protein